MRCLWGHVHGHACHVLHVHQRASAPQCQTGLRLAHLLALGAWAGAAGAEVLLSGKVWLAASQLRTVSARAALTSPCRT